MQDNPLVSIIIPVYNLENYINNTLRTVLNQSMKDFEVIIIDDGSDDKSLSIVNSIKKNDSRIRVYSQHNNGQASARNIGISHAKGSFLTFVDGDDLVKKDYLKTMLDPMLKDPKLDIVALPHLDASINDIPNLYDEKSNKKNIYFYLDANEYLIKALKYNNNQYNVSFASKMYSSSLFQNFKIPEGHYYEDLAGLPELLNMARNMLWIDNEQYVYLDDRPSSTVNLMNIKKAKDIIWALDSLVKIFNNGGQKIKDALQITIVNNLYKAYHPLKDMPIYLKKIDVLLKNVSIGYVLIECARIHISKKGIILLVYRKFIGI